MRLLTWVDAVPVEELARRVDEEEVVADGVVGERVGAPGRDERRRIEDGPVCLGLDVRLVDDEVVGDTVDVRGGLFFDVLFF